MDSFEFGIWDFEFGVPQGRPFLTEQPIGVDLQGFVRKTAVAVKRLNRGVTHG